LIIPAFAVLPGVLSALTGHPRERDTHSDIGLAV
jgi:hypothetical protein